MTCLLLLSGDELLTDSHSHCAPLPQQRVPVPQDTELRPQDTEPRPLRAFRVGVGVARRRRRPGEFGHAAREPEALGVRVVHKGGGVGEDHGGRVRGEVVAAEGGGGGTAYAVGCVVGGARLPRDAVVPAVERVDGVADGARRFRYE